MREWLLTATSCSCTSLDVCALFEPDGAPTPATDQARALRISDVRPAASST